MPRLNPLTRRSFLNRMGAAATVTTVAATRTRAKTTNYNGQVVFVYDDAPLTDFTKAYPVHRDENVPACTAAIANEVGNEDRLSANQLHQLAGSGWEIMSHSLTHRALDEVPVTRDVDPTDTKIYVESPVHGWEPGPIQISDGETVAVVSTTGTGSDEDGEFLTLDESVGTAFDAEDGVTERFTDEILKQELHDSQRWLESHGFTVTNFVVPYYRYGQRTRELVPKYYDAVPNGYGGGINPIGEIDQYAMNRKYFRENRLTERELTAWFDTVAEGNLGVLGGHTYYEDLTEERIRLAIRLAKERDIEVVTLRDALTDLGIVEPAETNSKSSPTTAPSTTDEPARLKSPTTSLPPKKAEPTSGRPPATTPASTTSTAKQPSIPWGNTSEANDGLFISLSHWLQSLL